MANAMEMDWLKKWNLYSPNNVALMDGDTGREITYSQLYQSACVGAEVLKKQFHIESGDRIAVLSVNELEYITLFFAAQRLGAMIVPINYRLTAREVEHIVGDCKPKLLVHESSFDDLVQQLTAGVRPEQCLHLIGKNSFAELVAAKLTSTKLSTAKSDNQNSISTATAISNSSTADSNYFANLTNFAGDENSIAQIIYTSGTTGAPKGAMISNGMLFWNSINTSLRLNINQSDATVIFLPFFHTGGWNVLTTPFLHRGAKIILLKKFDPDRILELSESQKCTLLFGVPTTMDMMARSAVFPKVQLKNIRYAIVGGEPMPVELIQTWHNKGIPIRQGYGLTEFGPNVFSLNEQDAIRKIGSIGFPNFYIDIKVVNDDGHAVAANEVGELLLKGPSMMTGYWHNDKATKETIVDGWLHTGDLVRQDAEGYVYVVGRKKDMYKSGGENVYPAELEKVIRSLPGIRDVAVIGVKDEKWGEVGKAYVVLESNCDFNSDQASQKLSDHCLKNLAKFKIPKYFKVVPELPKGDSGKILKRKLLEVYPD